MPRRPTRFEILIPQLMKEAEVGDVAEPPSSGYQAIGRFDLGNWSVTPLSVSFILTERPAGCRI